MSDDENPEGLKCGKRFIVQKYLTGGSFGRLYIGKDIVSGQLVAIKMEKKDIERKQLVFEFAFFKKLKAFSSNNQQKGIPKIHFFGPCGAWSALVMDLLGPSLEKVHTKCGEQFSLKTTVLLTLQLIEIFEYFHGCGLIYRDIKPENFLFGQSGTDKYSTVHIIDLGLSKEYIDDSGQHIKFRDKKGLTGTVRYVSINSHKGYEISRRDDLEALTYMIIFFIKGELPWMGIKASDIKTKYKMIGQVKEKTKPELLCADIPQEFASYLKAVRALEFEETPQYKGYISLFNKLLTRHGLKNDNIYDFDKNHRPLKKK